MSAGWQEVRADAVRLLSGLGPDAYRARYSELLRGGLSASSIPEGSRSPESPLPGVDNTDVGLRHDYRAYADAWKQLAVVCGRLAHLENALLLVLGVDVSADDPVVYARARRETIRKAREVLKDDAPGGYFFRCENCGVEYQRTAQVRKRAGRCPACYAYWAAHDRTADAPVDVTERR